MTPHEAAIMIERILFPEPWEYEKWSDKAEKALEMAYTALNRQTLTTPNILIGKNNLLLYKCPTCDNPITVTNFCPNCGQALNWGINND